MVACFKAILEVRGHHNQLSDFLAIHGPRLETNAPSSSVGYRPPVLINLVD